MANPLFLYDNRFADGDYSVSGTASGYTPSNLIDWRPFTWWKPDSGTASVQIDTGATTSADALIIEPHTLQSSGGGAAVTVSKSANGSSWTQVATTNVASDDPVVLVFTSASDRWWKVDFVATNPFEIAMMCLGNRLEMPHGLNEGFDPIGRKVSERTNVSMTGQVLGRLVRGQEWSQSINFQLLQWAWVRANWESAWDTHLVKEPFYFSWDYDTYPDETRIVVAGDSFKTPHRAGQLCDLSLQLSGVA